jgi:hypothetical protein
MNDKEKAKDLETKINSALDVIEAFGSTEGTEHKQWVIDQVVRKLLGEEAYEVWKENFGWDEECQERVYGNWEEGSPP